MASLVETPPIIHAVGLVTVRWATVDKYLAEILGIVLRNEEAGMACIFDGVDSGARRFEAFIGVVGASSLPEADRKLLINAVQKLKDLLPERNRIIHSPLVLNAYIEGDKMGMQLQRLGRKSKAERSRFKNISLDNINKHADEVKDRGHVLFNWWLQNRP